jgi:hypothetical protein
MDYLSAGHFEIYNDIAKACEIKGEQSLALAQQLYPKISASTDVALSFNDKYAETKQGSALPDFDAELSRKLNYYYKKDKKKKKKEKNKEKKEKNKEEKTSRKKNKNSSKMSKKMKNYLKL